MWLSTSLSTLNTSTTGCLFFGNKLPHKLLEHLLQRNNFKCPHRNVLSYLTWKVLPGQWDRFAVPPLMLVQGFEVVLQFHCLDFNNLNGYSYPVLRLLIHIVTSMSCIYICRHLANEHLVCLIHITSATASNIINSEQSLTPTARA